MQLAEMIEKRQSIRRYEKTMVEPERKGYSYIGSISI
jgi:hypothetical protein